MSHLKPNELAAVRELKAGLDRDFGLVRLILYGSKARGDSGPGSDIDLIVVLDGRPDWQTKRAIYHRCFEVGLKHDVVLQPVVFAEADFTSARYSVTPLVRNVAAEGVAI